MFNIGGTLYERFGEREVSEIGIADYSTMRQRLASIIYVNQLDDVVKMKTVPGAWRFPQEESDIYVVPTTPDAIELLNKFAQAVKKNDYCFINEETECWADGDPYTEDDDEKVGII